MVNSFADYVYSKEIWQKLLVLVVASFVLRAAVFFFYIQHEERYRQADSMDYHLGAVALTAQQKFINPTTGKYNFWRVPGYPTFLKPFYQWYGIKNYHFNQNTPAQKAAIWVQIVLCSFTCVLVFFLTVLLTNSLPISWAVSTIFVFHLGFVLASCYLLTDALAMLFFFLFLILFYQIIPMQKIENYKSKYLLIVCAAVTLALYTWLRPNGEFIALASIATLLLCSSAPWLQKGAQSVLFFAVFFACLSPWYIRNHQLTGKWFFCPMQGPYLLAFNAPKVIRRLTGEPLEKCIKYLFTQTGQQVQEQEKLVKIIAPGKVIAQEFICKEVAWPYIAQYPHYVLIDWLREVCKTTFDLYSSQLVAFANKCYTFDPLEEFLGEKLKLCIYKQSMSRFMRLLCWLELLFNMLLWIGIVGGFILFIIGGLLNKFYCDPRLQFLWLKTGLMIGALVGMTGGFGYARLRMGAEPLLIILSATFWVWVFWPHLLPWFAVQSNKQKNDAVALKGKKAA